MNLTKVFVIIEVNAPTFDLFVVEYLFGVDFGPHVGRLIWPHIDKNRVRGLLL